MNQPSQVNGSASGRDNIGPDLLQGYSVTSFGGPDGFVFMVIVSLSVWVFVVFLSLISFHRGTAGNPARYNVEILDFFV